MDLWQAMEAAGMVTLREALRRNDRAGMLDSLRLIATGKGRSADAASIPVDWLSDD